MTIVLVLGIRESARANAVMVVFKVLLVLVFVGVGAFFIQPANYVPFAPNGFERHLDGRLAGVLLATSASTPSRTAAEETRDPAAQPAARDHRLADRLHRAVRGHRRGDDRHGAGGASWAPATRWPYALQRAGLERLATFMAFGAVVAVTAVLLVFQLGQARIFMAMSRDGLLPPVVRPGPPALPHARPSARW